MVGPNRGWLRILVQSMIVTSVVAVLAMGCASSPPAPSSEGAGVKVQTLKDLSVSRDGDDSVIRLAGLVDPIYSVSMPEGDNVIFIDLVAVAQPEAASLMGEVRDEASQIATYDGVIDLITVATFDDEGGTPLTRVEIVTAAESWAEVVSTEDGLEIRVMLGAATPAAPEMADAGEISPEGGVVSEPWGSELEVDGEVALVAAVVETTPPQAAARLVSVTAEATESGVLVGIQADGAIGNLETFTLSDPARLVIDFPGLAMGEGVSNMAVDSTVVTGVRIGSHDGKIRVVLDGGADANEFEGRQIVPGTTGLWLAIGTGEALSQAMHDALAANEAAWLAASQPVSEEQDESHEKILADAPAMIDEAVESAAIDESVDLATSEEDVAEFEVASIEESTPIETLSMEDFELAEIFGLHFERTEGMDRTAILADESIPYTMTTPNATTVVISLPNSKISHSASDRIFPTAGGPISLIHAFQQPDMERPEVRVVFTRAPDQMPIVSRRGSMLFVDFEDLGIAAAPPPAFPNAGLAEDGASSEVEMATLDALGMSASEEPAEVDALAAVMGSDANASDASMSAMSMEEGTTPIEVASDLPSFESGSNVNVEDLPAAIAAGNSVWDAPTEVAGLPAAVEVPAAIELLEEGGLIDGKEYRGRRVSLDFKDVEIADVLRLIAEVSDLNIIAGDEVSGNVTIRLVEVPWDQALDVILMTKGLGFIRVGNVLRIAPTEILKAEEEVRLQERRNKEKLEDLEVKLLPVNYAAVKDVVGLVKRLLSARGTVNIDLRTNTLIIKDISSVIDEASALISAIDTQTPQVMIEAKIVEASLGFSRELGTIWGIQTQQFNDPFNSSSGQRTDLGGEDLTFIDNNSLIFANPITSVPTGVATIGALILDQDFRIDAQIQAAEATGDGKIISSPRIVTLDNKEAMIEQGVSIPFQTFEGGDAKLEFIDAVLSLTVTPHITADESIIMKIKVTRDAPDDSVSTPTGSPAIAKNTAKTETLVRDGQTLVLGGIYTITKSQRQTRVPYLHRIPVIGNLFKATEITDARKELLIFVTPRIVRLPEVASN